MLMIFQDNALPSVQRVKTLGEMQEIITVHHLVLGQLEIIFTKTHPLKNV